MDNFREINETMVKYVVDSTRKSVEFNQKLWADYVELTKSIVSRFPGLDSFNKK